MALTNKPLEQQIVFLGKPLREIVLEALQYIGIKDFSDFDLKEENFNNPRQGNHDARHIYRVMLATALIAQEINDSRRGLLAFCGAFIHDLAQLRDGEGSEHGPRAAKTKWEMFNYVWEKYQLSEDERSMVRAAVSHHSGGGNSGFLDDVIVNHILHDADALDRCRFHKHGRFDWNYIALQDLKCVDGTPPPMLKKLIGYTEAICGYTKFVRSFIPFSDFVRNIK